MSGASTHLSIPWEGEDMYGLGKKRLRIYSRCFLSPWFGKEDTTFHNQEINTQTEPYKHRYPDPYLLECSHCSAQNMAQLRLFN